MIQLKLRHRLGGSLTGCNLLSCRDERVVILLEICFSEREKTIERNVDHLVVEQFVSECFLADCICAFRFWKEVRLQPFRGVVESCCGRIVCGGEITQCGRVRSRCTLGPGGDVAFEETDRAARDSYREV